jgi:hypothetical protein
MTTTALATALATTLATALATVLATALTTANALATATALALVLALATLLLATATIVTATATSTATVGILKGGYVHNVPLPRVPQIQSTSLATGREPPNTCYSQVPRVPTWGDITRLLAGLGRKYLPFSPVQLIQLIN